ncbi:hypothetical protein GW17_00060612 [Ensete ventricosum]|nr:hypothetical protein GW17_00060612 [Ensete ventricosum]
MESMLSHVENLHKQEKLRLVNLSKRLDIANSFVQEDTFKDDSRIDDLKELKPKKIAKRPLRSIPQVCSFQFLFPNFCLNHLRGEENDRGKRKKLRKSQLSFGGPNPFRETANVKAHQKLKSELGQTKRRNQPLRI